MKKTYQTPQTSSLSALHCTCVLMGSNDPQNSPSVQVTGINLNVSTTKDSGSKAF
ncbi:MAG: hypothetical protein IJ249_08335 [Paludibacteraceae bacterium]|nr:hypothetical protein [Paludibacteraceae bacterium]